MSSKKLLVTKLQNVLKTIEDSDYKSAETIYDVKRRQRGDQSSLRRELTKDYMDCDLKTLQTRFAKLNKLLGQVMKARDRALGHKDQKQIKIKATRDILDSLTILLKEK